MRPDGSCVFLAEDNGCVVYDVRPPICRVDEARPPGLSVEEWYRANAQACDRMQVEDGLDGKYRLPIVGVQSR